MTPSLLALSALRPDLDHVALYAIDHGEMQHILVSGPDADLIRAMNAIHSRHPGLRLLVCSPGDPLGVAAQARYEVRA